MGSRQVFTAQERGETLRGRAERRPRDAVSLQLWQKGHMGSTRASALLGKAVAVLPAAERLQEAISSPEDGLGLSRLDSLSSVERDYLQFCWQAASREAHIHTPGRDRSEPPSPKWRRRFQTTGTFIPLG